MLLACGSSWCWTCVSSWLRCSVRRCGYVDDGGWSYLYLEHSLVILVINVGSLWLVWYYLMVLCFGRSRIFPCPQHLLFSKPCSSSRKTTLFLEFPHSLIVTCTHLPLIIPFISPHFVMVSIAPAHQSSTTWGASSVCLFHKQASSLTTAGTIRIYLLVYWRIPFLLHYRI